MSELVTNKITPSTGSSDTVTLGDSGDTFTIPSGVNITNSGTATGFGGGKCLQFLQFPYNANTSSSSTSWVDTPLVIAITPTASTSKIWLTWCINVSGSQHTGMAFQATQNGSAIHVGDASGSLHQVTTQLRSKNYDEYEFTMLTDSFLTGAVGSTSTQTFKLQWKRKFGSTAMYLNVSQDQSGSDRPVGVSTISVMEIGA
jgi:hypothetical protein